MNTHILDRYLARAVIRATIIVMLVLLGIETFIEFIGQLSSIGTYNYGVKAAFEYVPLQVPTDLYQLFPVAAFIGCLTGLGGLAKYHQLVVMQAAGYSVWRVVWAVVKAAMMMLIVVTFVGEVIAPYLVQKADQIRETALKQNPQSTLPSIWLRHDNSYIYINSLPSWRRLNGFVEFNFNQQHQLQSLISAKRAVETNDTWQLQEVKSTHKAGAKVVTTQLPFVNTTLQLNPKLIWLSQQDPTQTSIFNLYRTIRYRYHMGLNSMEFSYSFWQRLLQPLTTIVMIILGVPFLLGSMRHMTMGTRLLIGAIIGFGFYMLNQFFGPFSLVFQMPPILAAALPTALFAVAALILLRRTH